ncbi:hypothetical protein RRG08_005577, partial [Elysia crispata]
RSETLVKVSNDALCDIPQTRRLEKLTLDPMDKVTAIFVGGLDSDAYVFIHRPRLLTSDQVSNYRTHQLTGRGLNPQRLATARAIPARHFSSDFTTKQLTI